MKVFFKILGALLGVGILGFSAVQAVYWTNADNKFMFLLYKILQKNYENVPRDRRF